MANMPYSAMAPKKTLHRERGSAGADREHATPSLPRPVIWVGSSKDDISALPGPVKASFGHRLRQVQDGETPLDMRPLTQFGTGLFELRERFDKNAFRLVYVVNLEKAIYVLHAFMKKSKSGFGLPKQDTELIETRLKRAHILDAED
jgi:phage-related protein